jgi:hypothetical protein
LLSANSLDYEKDKSNYFFGGLGFGIGHPFGPQGLFAI